LDDAEKKLTRKQKQVEQARKAASTLQRRQLAWVEHQDAAALPAPAPELGPAHLALTARDAASWVDRAAALGTMGAFPIGIETLPAQSLVLTGVGEGGGEGIHSPRARLSPNPSPSPGTSRAAAVPDSVAPVAVQIASPGSLHTLITPAAVGAGAEHAKGTSNPTHAGAFWPPGVQPSFESRSFVKRSPGIDRAGFGGLVPDSFEQESRAFASATPVRAEGEGDVDV